MRTTLKNTSSKSRVTAGFPVCFFLFCLANTAWSTVGFCNPRIFFHWGNPGNNRDLLTLGGYAQGTHHEGLSKSPDAKITPQLTQKVREWYLEDPTDLAGPGFYMSTDALDSASYGTDLLVVEIKQTKPGPFQTHNPESLRALKTQVVKDPSLVKPIHQYADFEPNWHVITRAPEEADEVTIGFRPPRAQDVETTWSAIQSLPQEQVLKFLAKLAALTNNGTEQGKITTSTQIFLDRLLYDHGYQYLRKNPVNLHTESSNTELYEQILEGFLKRIPVDQKTRQLRTDYVASFQDLLHPKDNELPQTYARSLPSIAKHLELLDPMVLSNSVETLVDAVESRQAGPKEILALIQILKRANLPDAEFETIKGRVRQATRDKYALWQPKSETEKRATLSGFKMNNSELKEFEALLGEKNFLDLAVAAYKEIVDNVNCNERSLDEDSEILTAHLNSLVHYFAEIPSDLLRKLIKYGNKLLETERGDCRQVLNLALLAMIQPNSGQDLSLAQNRKKIADELAAAASTESLGKSIFLEQVLKLKKKAPPDKMESEFIRLVKVYPNLQEGYLFALEKLLAEVPRKKIEQPVRFGKIIQELQRNEAIRDWAKKRVERMALSLKEKAQESKGDTKTPDSAAVDILWEKAKKTIIKDSTRIIENFKGHPNYSEISRIFHLVDPIYVSEDLRRNNANHPFKRFNETYIYQGKDYPQPTWENFTTNWDLIAVERQAANQVKDPDFRTKMLKSILARSNRRLLGAFVDGGQVTLQKQGGSSWDRTKYEFTVSKTDWDYLHLDKNNKTNRFLESIDNSDGSHRFRFKTHEELYSMQELRKEFRKYPESDILALVAGVEKELNEIKDPIRRAARMTMLMAGLHIFENGNGRELRTIVAQDLIRAGFPMPVGLPTNDLFMTEEELMLEIRKAIKLGEFWEQMIKKAILDQVPIDDFFQKRFRGSALEGLTLISPSNFEEKKKYVEWLEKQDAPPQWASDFTPALFNQITLSHPGLEGKNLGQVSEIQKYVTADRAWQDFKKKHSISLDARVLHETQRSNSAVSPKGVDPCTQPQKNTIPSEPKNYQEILENVKDNDSIGK